MSAMDDHSSRSLSPTPAGRAEAIAEVQAATEVGQPTEEALQRLRGRYVLDPNALMHVAGSDWVTPELVTRLSRDPRPPSAAGSDGKPGARGYAAPVCVHGAGAATCVFPPRVT
jgi:hypothetical protein